MKIGVIVPPWFPVPPTGYGGLEVLADNLVRGLDEAGHEVLLCCTGDSTCPVPRFSYVDRGVGMPGIVRYELGHVAKSYEALVEWGPDIIHDHTLSGPLTGRDTDIPLVATNHTTFDPYVAAHYVPLSMEIPIVAVSKHAARVAQSRGVRIAHVIYNGTDVEAVEPGFGDGGYIAWIGRFDEEKGCHRAIKVAKELHLNLKIAARPPDVLQARYFENHVEPHIGYDTDGHYVEWLGEITGFRKSELLGGAACLLNPIRWEEPFGMVMIEALAHGTPVVATHEGAAPEIVRNGLNGYIVEDDDELADAVVLCLQGTIDRTRCRKSAEDRFSTRRMVREHLEFYENVIRVIW